MLDQENQSNATVGVQHQQSTVTNNIADNNNSNNKDDNTTNSNSNDIDSSNKILPDSNGTNHTTTAPGGCGGTKLLNEHDYCSPNKNSSNKTSNTGTKESANHTDANFKQHGDELNSQSTLSATECQASTSTSPCAEGNNGDKSSSVQLPKMPTDNQDGNLSDDSSSSSSITSDDSTMDLIIASEGFERRAKPIAPKDTPSVSKPKLGRRPNLKTDFIIGKSKSQKQPQKPSQPRPKRPRQNVSVTDKSQWITGDEQIDSALADQQPAQVRDKRQRKEVHDPLYSRFTSSDYSSSDAESDQASDAEDDPNRNWCICDKPYDGKFMIGCEICEYWFHGACVGVTESMNERWEKEKKEWFCHDCNHALQSGTPRSAIPSRIIKKEKKKPSSKKLGKRRGRPRKSSSPALEVSTRLSLRNAKKANDSLDSRSGTASSTKKSNARSESFEKFGDTKRLKELIKERKEAFFQRHRLSEQLKAEKMKEFGIGRKSMTASLGGSMNSLVSNTNSPNMNNLPISIKSEHKERSKPNIVLQINTKKDGTSESSGQRIVTTIVKKRKHADSSETTSMSSKIKVEPQNGDAPQRTPPATDALAFLDSTKDHKNHIFDINCKICTKQKKEGSDGEEESDEKSKKAEGSETEPNIKIEQQDKPPEPKRLRISIDSKLDPSKILRLKEPLIKPEEQPKDVIEYSPSRISPAGQSNSDSAEADDVDDVYDPETSTLGPRKSLDSLSPPIERSSNEPCWTGTITMPDVCKFSASARAVSGNSDFMQTDFNKNLLICGRVAPEQVYSFVKKLKSTSRNEFILVQLHPLTENDKSSFDALFEYLYARNRSGVINNSANSRILKDYYMLPIHESQSIPDILKPLKGPGLDRREPNCLMFLFIKSVKRPPSASSSASNYTPTPMS